MRVRDFEEQVWKVDRIRILIHAAYEAVVQDFGKVYAAKQSTSVTEYMKTWIHPKIGDLEVSIIGGSGEKPNGNMLISNLRLSYHV